MTKILLLGRNGQVGWELRRCLEPLGDVVALNSKDLNLEDGKSIRKTVNTIKPNLIINAAAYTGVDQAEKEPEKARLINAVAPGILAEEAKRLNAFLVHYSTDYVFDGMKGEPYTEDDLPNPINVYGRTKLEGEHYIKSVDACYLILRTCWVYGMRGNNFLMTMQRLSKVKEELRVVNDQIGSPTWCRMVAETTALLLSRYYNAWDKLAGTYHICAAGQTSWYGFARAIFNHVLTSEEKHARLISIPTSEYKTPAARPAYSVLSCRKIEENHCISLPNWNHSLKLMVESFIK